MDEYNTLCPFSFPYDWKTFPMSFGKYNMLHGNLWNAATVLGTFA